MCIFGGGGSSSSSDGPVSKGPSDQTTAAREDSMQTKAQVKRDPLGRGGGVSGMGRSARKRSGGHGTLLTAGATDETGKKTLLGA